MAVNPAVRSVEPPDHEAILVLVKEAFIAPDHDGREEVQIVLDTWHLNAVVPGLEIVAVEGKDVVGHVLGARGRPGSPGVVAVAPLCVSPDWQHQGIGSALMNELLDRADQQRWPAVVALGNPAYYGRFGFRPAGPLGVVYEMVGRDSPHFQMRSLSSFDSSIAGAFHYCWET